jgi:hypothetical protein
VPAIVSVFFCLAQKNIKKFYKGKINVFVLGLSLGPSITSFLASDTQQDLWLLISNAISIRKRVFHILFFLNLLGLFEQGLSACSVLKSVQATKNLYPFFSVFLTDNGWQEESSLLYNHSSL